MIMVAIVNHHLPLNANLKIVQLVLAPPLVISQVVNIPSDVTVLLMKNVILAFVIITTHANQIVNRQVLFLMLIIVIVKKVLNAIHSSAKYNKAQLIHVFLMEVLP